MYVAIRDAQLKHTGHPDPWASLKALDVRAMELGVDRELRTEFFLGDEGGKPFALADAASLSRLQARLKAEGARVCALLMANDFLGDLDAEVRWGVAAVEAAAALGAPAVRVDMVPRGRKDVDLDAFASRCAEAARLILAKTASSGVALATENHGSITNRPEFLERIFAAVDSPRMGLTLDTGNFYWWGHPIGEVYGIMERLAPRARHTHVKNIRYPAEQRETQREMGWEYKTYNCPVYEGDIDHRRVAGILRKAGYDGALTLEDESIGKAPESERTAVLRKELEHLRACIAG